MGKKRVLVSYGVDIDAVSGWLGSYGGEDSASDISRGMNGHTGNVSYTTSSVDLTEKKRSLCWTRRYPTPPQTFPKIQYQSDLVHPRPFARNIP